MMRGQGDAWARWLRRARRLEIPHCLIVEGAPGTGKSKAARTLARALLCRGETVDGPCGTCAACRKVDAASHPDLHLLLVPEDKRDIPVESVRALIADLARLPVEGGARVVVVDPADGLNEQGQNALLKTLEEPGRDTFLLLATGRPDALLETVRSRAARMRTLPLSDREVGDALAAEGRTADPAVLEAARGSIGRARWLASEEVRALGSEVARFLADPAASVRRGREFLQLAGSDTPAPEAARAVLRVLQGHLGQHLRAALANGERPTYPAGATGLYAALDAVFAAEEDLGLSIPPPQVLDELFLRLAELLTGRFSSA